MKKLYEVEVDFTMFVMAEDESKAKDVAQANVNEEIDNLNSRDFGISRTKFYPYNWENAYPYGSDTNQTVKEILEAEKEAAKKQAEREEWEKKQIALPGF